MTTDSKVKKTENNFWPNTATIDGARSAARQGVWAAGFVATVTTALAIYSRFGEAIVGVDLWALGDVILFGIIGIGIWRLSRVASVLGLGLYIAERVWMFQANGKLGGVLMVLLILMFVNGVRGTFAYHRLNAETTNAAKAD
ncbi:MAG: hypothetical protein AAGH76_16800 [Pseudomonadota bacterium]